MEMAAPHLRRNFPAPSYIDCISYCELETRAIPKIPRMSLFLMFLAFIAFLQSIRMFDLEPRSMQPASVRLQQWCLGKDVDLASSNLTPLMRLAAQQSGGVQTTLTSLDQPGLMSDELLQKVQQLKSMHLAVSLAPEITRSSTVALLYCSALIWIGSMVFTSLRSIRWLCIVLVGLGVAIASMHFIQMVAWQVPSWAANNAELGQSKSQFPVGPFYNKNFGAAYLCLSFAAASDWFFRPFRNAPATSVADHIESNIQTAIELSKCFAKS